MDVWAGLRRSLAALSEDSHAQIPPTQARHGATLVLLHDPGDGDLEVVYTRRRDDLANHPSQISFPGGRVDPGETIEQAALREATEEIALDPGTVEILGHLPAFYIPPSRFWMSTVVARWHDQHELVPAEAEVAEVLRARLSRLRDPAIWRCVRLSTRGHSWAWQLDDRHLLWGATGVVTGVLLDLIDPGWCRGLRPQDLGPECLVEPWQADLRRPGNARAPLLPDAPEVDARTVGVDATPPAGRPSRDQVDRAAEAVAGAIESLLTGQAGPVLVLAGAGGNGTVGTVVARILAGLGLPVTVVSTAPEGLPVAAFDGTLPEASVVVDALVGAGLRGQLSGVPRDMVLALRRSGAPIVSVDVPTGIDPVHGLVGEAVSADATVALETVRPGLFLPGLAPFVGDLYVTEGAALRRVVDLPAQLTGSGWRE